MKPRYPTSPIGPGWRSLFYASAPAVLSAIRGHASGHHEDAAHTGGRLADEGLIRRESAGIAGTGDRESGGSLNGPSGRKEHSADHVIAPTRYEVDLRRLTFLRDEIRSGRSGIRAIDRAPVLSPYFETSKSGLYVVGSALKYCFGPVMQFACGAHWTATRLSRHLARAHLKRRRIRTSNFGHAESVPGR